MWFRLAKELGMSLARCQQEVSSAEFTEWVAYYSIEPFGDRIADLRAGIAASLLANINRSKDTEPFAPLDFVPWAKDPEPDGPPPPEAIAALFGVSLAKEKQSGKKRIILQRRKS